jgi:hypothetical protein
MQSVWQLGRATVPTRKRRRSAPCRASTPVEDLAESLAEGIVSGHPDMPIFVFSTPDVEAIIDYLNSIQEKPSKPADQPRP